MISYEELVALFEKANKTFLQSDVGLLCNGVAERTLCGALMYHLRKITDGEREYEGYYADVEYNRNDGRVKTMIDDDFSVVKITCDLILHSRGLHPEQDNLIALEMKKAHRPQAEKQDDKNRLIALTRTAEDEGWSNGESALPEHVCGYALGVYYEIDYVKEKIHIEYYKRGQYQATHSCSYKRYKKANRLLMGG